MKMASLNLDLTVIGLSKYKNLFEALAKDYSKLTPDVKNTFDEIREVSKPKLILVDDNSDDRKRKFT